MATDIETVVQRLKSFLGQILTERGILERIVYKHKNQHRRCSYFQYVLKVRRDLNLLKSVNLEEILDASFLVINGNKPQQKVQLLESLKRRRCDGGKYNFLERLLGAARLLSQMVEPLLRAAMYPFILVFSLASILICSCDVHEINQNVLCQCFLLTILREISTLLAQSFFMKLSLTTLAVLARLRVLVQQVLVDVVLVYNYVSSLSQREHTIKLNQEGFELFREYYPRKMEATVTLDCIWQIDKYVLVERTYESESKSQEKDGEENVFIQPSNIKYDNIEAFLGDESDPIDVELVSAEPIVGEESPVNHLETHVQNDSHSAGSSSFHLVSHKSETCGENLMEYDSLTASSTGPLVKPVKHRSPTKKSVAFVSVNPRRTPLTANQSKFQLRGTEKSGEDHC
ncbi:uncharacterized protein LOC142519340 isoform X2 [Primulina tabacum]|uniref:uncharacterized protein LOC142519340 isoform X2 n=1 Tax=Primulina tabacum TaxID=48773 RepID=UPI003F5A91C9